MSTVCSATPESPPEEQPVIGLIGMGEMGRMYARHLSHAGWKRRVALKVDTVL